jgi:DNA-binding LytR/AlgR family response regulator
MVQVAILLDWQMPELDGIAVVRMLKKDVMPLVAFVTAYDEYAVTAFALNAVDYLLKPVDKARLRETLNRARERIEHAEILTEQASRARWHTCGAVEHRPRIACEPIAVKNSPRTFPEAVRAASVSSHYAGDTAALAFARSRSYGVCPARAPCGRW